MNQQPQPINLKIDKTPVFEIETSKLAETCVIFDMLSGEEPDRDTLLAEITDGPKPDPYRFHRTYVKDTYGYRKYGTFQNFLDKAFPVEIACWLLRTTFTVSPLTPMRKDRLAVALVGYNADLILLQQAAQETIAHTCEGLDFISRLSREIFAVMSLIDHHSDGGMT